MKSMCGALVVSVLAFSSLLDTAAHAGPHQQKAGPLIIEKQGSFFIGGRDIHSSHLGEIPPFSQEGTVTVDQVYVQYQIPQDHRRTPLVLLHGCCLTSASWQTTPDGREGWDQIFLRYHHPVYLMDQAWRGRSGMDVTAINAVRAGAAPPEDLPVATSASHEAAWEIFRFGPHYPQVYPDQQFPISAQKALWQQMVPNFARSPQEDPPTIAALAQLSATIGHAVLVSHSQSGIYPFRAFTIQPTAIAGIIAIEPASCPDAADDLKTYAKLPILVVFGDYIEQSPRWAPRHAACQAFVKAARAIGAKAELVDLPAIGIHGNSHMIMQDKNNKDVAGIIEKWMEKNHF